MPRAPFSLSKKQENFRLVKSSGTNRLSKDNPEGTEGRTMTWNSTAVLDLQTSPSLCSA